MNKWKKQIIEFGSYTIDPILLNNIINQNERCVLDLITHFEDIKQNYISYSLLELYSHLSINTIRKMKDNLIQLNFISVVSESAKGTIYKINWNVIYNILHDMELETNIINRIIIADKYRTEKGLNSLCNNTIKKYKDSPFDFDLLEVKTQKENLEDDKKEIKALVLKPIPKNKNDLLGKFNDIQTKLNDTNNKLEINDLNNELNRLKMIAKQKKITIILNKDLQTWIQKN